MRTRLISIIVTLAIFMVQVLFCTAQVPQPSVHNHTWTPSAPSNNSKPPPAASNSTPAPPHNHTWTPPAASNASTAPPVHNHTWTPHQNGGALSFHHHGTDTSPSYTWFGINGNHFWSGALSGNTPSWSPAGHTGGAAHQVNLNLSSTSDTNTGLHFLNNETVDINVGGMQFAVNSGTALTPAEQVAALQMLRTGSQTLLLDSQGSADGGSMMIGSRLSSQLSNLVIPQGVTVTDISRSGTLNVTGNLSDSGSLYVTTTDPAISNFSILASNITVGPQGLITTLTPGNLSLSLTAQNNIVNSGTIRNGGSLNLVVGSGNITNTGLIASTGGSINMATVAPTTDVNVNATGGTFQALSGNINVRDASFAGSSNINLNGGNYLSQNLNLYSGTGTVQVNAGQLTGNLNMDAGAAHVFVDTPILYLGNNNILGDPTYYNPNEIDINGLVNSNGNNLAIISGAGIIATGSSAQIQTGGGSLVMIAGGTITGNGNPTSGPLPGTENNITSNIQVSFTSSNGGNIDFTSSTANPVIQTGGGAVTLLANSSSNVSHSGNIWFPAGSTSINSSNGTNPGGSVLIIAGGSGGCSRSGQPQYAVQLGSVITGGAGPGGCGSKYGAVNVYTAAPTVSGGGAAIFTPSGCTSQTFVPAGGTSTPTLTANASINVGAITTGGGAGTGCGGSGGNAGNVTMRAGGPINTGCVAAYGGTAATSCSGSGGKGGNGGAITLVSCGGSVASISTGTIITAGGGGGGAGSSYSGGNGGNAGYVTVTAAGSIGTGSIEAYGGGGGGGSTSKGGCGGSGGVITLKSYGGTVAVGSPNSSAGLNVSGGGGGGGFNGFCGKGGGGSGGCVTVSAAGGLTIYGRVLSAGGGGGGGSFASYAAAGGGGSFGGGGGGAGNSGCVTYGNYPGGNGGGYNRSSSDGSGSGFGKAGVNGCGLGGAGGQEGCAARPGGNGGNAGSAGCGSQRGAAGAGGAVTLNSCGNITLKNATSSIITGGGSVILSAKGSIMTGTITTAGGGAAGFNLSGGLAGGNAGCVTIKACGSINTGCIAAYGGGGSGAGRGANVRGNCGGGGGNGGNIILESYGGAVTVGTTCSSANLNVSGGGGGGGGGCHRSCGQGNGGGGGKGGSVSVSAAKGFTIYGQILSTGGGGGGGGGSGDNSGGGGGGSFGGGGGGGGYIGGNGGGFMGTSSGGSEASLTFGNPGKGAPNFSGCGGAPGARGCANYAAGYGGRAGSRGCGGGGYCGKGGSAGAGGMVTLNSCGNITLNNATTSIITGGGSVTMAAKGTVLAATITTAGGGGGATGKCSSPSSGYSAGCVTIRACASITTGPIRAWGGGGGGGGTSTNGGNGGCGGKVTLTSYGSTVTVNGDVNSSGGGGGGGGGNAYSGGCGGKAGCVNVSSAAGLTVNGFIMSAGGGGGGGGGSGSCTGGGGGGSFGAVPFGGNGGGGGGGGYGGRGGCFFVGSRDGALTTSNPGNGNPGKLGAFNGGGGVGGCRGFGSYCGGNGGNSGSRGTSGGCGDGRGGANGAGGKVSLTGQTVAINGMRRNGPFIGQSANALGCGGSITVNSYGGTVSPTYQTNADYAQNAPASPIGNIAPNYSFTTAGTLEAPTITISGTPPSSFVSAGSYQGYAAVRIAEGTNLVVLSTGSPVTPAENIAAVQASTTGQTLVLSQTSSGINSGYGFASGGSFTIANANLPGSDFNSFNLPGNVTENITANSLLTYSGSSTINGTINDTIAGGLLQFTPMTAGAPLAVTNTGTINLSGASSIIGFNGGPSSAITVSGNGSLTGSQVNFGNLNSSTLAIFSPFITLSSFPGSYTLGNISITQNSITGLMQVSGSPSPPTPTPTPTPTPAISLAELLTSQSSSQTQLAEEDTLSSQIGTRTPTDYTHGVHEPQQEQFPLKGNVSVEQVATAGEAEFSGGNFTASELRSLSSHGIVFGPKSGGNFFDLMKGNVLFMSNNDISVKTPECVVSINKHAAVRVMETGSDVTVYDLDNDAHAGEVSVVTNGKRIELSPGTQVLVTKFPTMSFDALNPGQGVGYRNLRVADVGSGLKAYVCEFSIPQAMSRFTAVHNLLLSKDPKERNMARRILKNAMIFADMSGYNYTTGGTDGQSGK